MTKNILAAAIDIGTEFSSYAFSSVSESHGFSGDPLQILSSDLRCDPIDRLSMGTPTCVLFNSTGNFDSYGDKAEEKYSNLVLDDEHRDWYFFRRFKMMLSNEKCLTKETILEDEYGKKMKAIKVFSSGVGYLKDHLLKICRKHITELEEEYDIKWVLTVPATWNDSSKLFLKEAAEKTGICSDKLMIVAEPEAAFLFCMYQAAHTEGHDIGSGIFEVGDKYMVVISEESTTEVTVYEVQHNGTLMKLYKAEGGDWGGNQVNASFYRLITDIVGIGVMEAFRLEYEDDFHELFRTFERKKMAKTSETDYVRIHLPFSLLKTFSKKDILSKYDIALINTVINSIPKYKHHVSFCKGNLRLDVHTFESLFNESCNSIIYHLKELLKFPKLEDVSSIIVVGHFADSPVFQVAMKEAFPDKNVIVPEDAKLAILKGAVLFGHQPKFKFMY